MGHYAGEMRYIRQDEFNYQAVNALGFEPVWSASTVVSCPRCFNVVLGKNAEAHWWSQHQKVVYVFVTPLFSHLFVETLSESEEFAVKWAEVNPKDIVFETVVDR